MPENYNISKGFTLCYSVALFKECDDNEQWSVLTSYSKKKNKVNVTKFDCVMKSFFLILKPWKQLFYEMY